MASAGSRCLPMQNPGACLRRIQVHAYAGSRCLPLHDPGACLCRIQVPAYAGSGTWTLHRHQGNWTLHRHQGTWILHRGPWDLRPHLGLMRPWAPFGPHATMGPHLVGDTFGPIWVYFIWGPHGTQMVPNRIQKGTPNGSRWNPWGPNIRILRLGLGHRSPVSGSDSSLCLVQDLVELPTPV